MPAAFSAYIFTGEFSAASGIEKHHRKVAQAFHDVILIHPSMRVARDLVGARDFVFELLRNRMTFRKPRTNATVEQ